MIIMILIILESVLMQPNGDSSPLRPSRRSHHIHYVNFPPSPPRLCRPITTIYILGRNSMLFLPHHQELPKMAGVVILIGEKSMLISVV